jgi:hypothetical protein
MRTGSHQSSLSRHWLTARGPAINLPFTGLPSITDYAGGSMSTENLVPESDFSSLSVKAGCVAH